MLDALRAWLNGNREYFTGVALLQQLSNNTALLNLLRKGKTDFTYKRLQDELLQICKNLKANSSSSIQKNISPATKDVAENKQPGEIKNPALYAACLKAANLLYKEMMNERAILFASAKVEGYEDVNRPDLVHERSKAAVDLVIKYQRVSELYDRAAHVKQFGKLPHELQADDDVKSEYDALPDHLVKQTLDNLRKNYNKIKKREQTAERIALLQKHEANIKKLAARWQQLKHAQ
jgi:hypothetical protein